MKDKRAMFFLGAALLCVLLIPLAEDQFREITIGVAVTYVVLALASYLDYRGKHRP